MTIASSRRRRAWRIGSTLAAVAGSVAVVAAVLARRPGAAQARRTDSARPPGDTSEPEPPGPTTHEIQPSSAAPADGMHGTAPPAEATPEPVLTLPPAAPPQVADSDSPPDPGVRITDSDSAPDPGVRTGRGPQLALGAGIVGLLVVVLGAMLTVGSSEDSDSDGSEARVATRDGTSSSGRPTTSSVDQLTPDEAFARAADQLQTAGSFGYQGISRATDVSHVRPGPWVAVELTVVGDVDLQAGRGRELQVSSRDGVAETITDGVTVWARVASGAEDIPAQPYETVRQLGQADPATPAPTGGALLPGWLAATVDRGEAPDHPLGRRAFRATLPAAVLGEIETGRPPVDAEVLMVLDAAGKPTHVEITTGAAGPALHLALDLLRIGQPVAVDVPVEVSTTERGR